MTPQDVVTLAAVYVIGLVVLNAFVQAVRALRD